jgi:hypothetical protein
MSATTPESSVIPSVELIPQKWQENTSAVPTRVAVAPSDATLIETAVTKSSENEPERTFEVSPVAVNVTSESTNGLAPSEPAAMADSVNVIVAALAIRAPMSRASATAPKYFLSIDLLTEAPKD